MSTAHAPHVRVARQNTRTLGTVTPRRKKKLLADAKKRPARRQGRWL